MKSASRGNLKMALVSMRSNKGRSLLTMLGIIIGVTAVVTVVGIGEGVKQQIAIQINHYGKDLITIRPGHVAAKRNAPKTISSTDLLFGLNNISGLSEKDLYTVQKTNHVKSAAPIGVVTGTVVVKHGPSLNNGLVLATNAELVGLLNQNVKYGTFLDADGETSNGAVLGSRMAQTLYQESVPLGRKFNFRGQTLIVHGVLDELHVTPLSPTADFNEAIFIPYQVARRATGGSQQFYTILAKPDNAKNTEAVITSVNEDLLKLHGGQQDFSVLSQKQNLAVSGNILDLLTAMISGVAAISLLVGGVGIMNIMLVSVTERMHEIGVRKAIGATNRQILSQFILEATVLSVAGGIIGMLLSLLVDLLLRAYTDLKPVVSWRAMTIAISTSIVIGIVFGVAPAIKAARKDPIEALRHE